MAHAKVSADAQFTGCSTMYFGTHKLLNSSRMLLPTEPLELALEQRIDGIAE